MLAALRNLDMSLDRDHPQRAPLLHNLGWLYARQPNWRKAVDYLGQALVIYDKQARRGSQSPAGELSGLPTTNLASHRSAVSDFVYAATNFVVRERAAAQSIGFDIMDRMLDATQQMPSAASVSLAQMSARRIRDAGPLARLVRERQDLVLEWQDRDKRLFERLLRGAGADAKDRIADRERLGEIDRRIADLDRTLARDFPEYATLTNPPPLSMSDVQALLRDDEALVAFVETPIQEQVWVWVISRTDRGMAVSNVGSDALAERVAALRCGVDALDWVDPTGWPAETAAERERKTRQEARYRRCRTLHPRYDGSGTLPFDANQAHALYKVLLGNMEKEIAGKRLLIVPSPSLTLLPFNALVTAPPDTGVPSDVQGYRSVKWLGTRQAITILPSIGSLAALRRNVRPTRASKAWIGFGNPLLDGDANDREQRQLAAEARVRQRCGPAAPRLRLTARGLRAAAIGDVFAGSLADVAQLRRQTPLPETIEELCDVAKQLGASDEEVWLGARATETAIKGLSARGLLDDYATIHFATHGLVAGALKGAAEPALMLTPPAKASEEDDGLLTASEVTQLKLDADWVVLSACNTAAGDAEGAEALSGLARAFFYAGARSLLVSHWEVESDAAVALTTQAFAAIKENPGIGRAEALRRSMLALVSDTRSVRNAHPSVWAPFVLVGEGAR
jgi:CHAT domain-containing protein